MITRADGPGRPPTWSQSCAAGDQHRSLFLGGTPSLTNLTCRKQCRQLGQRPRVRTRAPHTDIHMLGHSAARRKWLMRLDHGAVVIIRRPASTSTPLFPPVLAARLAIGQRISPTTRVRISHCPLISGPASPPPKPPSARHHWVSELASAGRQASINI
ncbi:hypothetical protein LX36DRAFT_45717 [Colletotrichum falcatum]|nr:hypothetical protein LX36DRAFT_45717 [Colletotrichum falcatum]